MKAMITLWIFCILLVVVAGQSQSGYVSIQPPSGFAPGAILIQPSTPDDFQICAAGSLVSCRSVHEFRDWVRTREQQFRK
jgi:hypothetical protein